MSSKPAPETDLPLHFVLSSPRSGSTWLAAALNQHPQVLATEQRLFGDFCQMWDDPNGRRSPRITLDAYAAAAAQHYFYQALGLDRQQFIDTLQRGFHRALVGLGIGHSGKAVVVDKITPYLGTASQVVRQLNRFFPHSRLALLVRDPRDVVTSGTFDWLSREEPHAPRYQAYVQGGGDRPLERFFDDRVIQTWASYWSDPLQAVAHWQGASPLVMRYESMLEDHAGQLERLFRHLGVEDDPAIARQCARATSFENLTGRPPGEHQPLAKARQGRAGDWKNYFTRHDGQLLDQLLGEELVRWQYAPDRDWWRDLPQKLCLSPPHSSRSGNPQSAKGEG